MSFESPRDLGARQGQACAFLSASRAARCVERNPRFHAIEATKYSAQSFTEYGCIEYRDFGGRRGLRDGNTGVGGTRRLSIARIWRTVIEASLA